MLVTALLLSILPLITIAYRVGHDKGATTADQFAVGVLVDSAPVLEQLASEFPDIHLSLITPIGVK